MPKGVNEVELKKMYDLYNSMYFNNELPQDIIISFSSRMTTNAGICRYKRGRQRSGTGIRLIPKEITLSLPYHNKFKTELKGTLIHEMIHVKYPEDGHNLRFKKEMERLNKQFGLNITQYTEESAIINYIYTCKECGCAYERTNRLNTDNYKCGDCGGKLDEKRIGVN